MTNAPKRALRREPTGGHRCLAALGARIRAAREAAELTQADIGRACGVAPNTIARIERGEQEPASMLLGAIAQALSVSADHLLGLEVGE